MNGGAGACRPVGNGVDGAAAELRMVAVKPAALTLLSDVKRTVARVESITKVSVVVEVSVAAGTVEPPSYTCDSSFDSQPHPRQIKK